MKATNDKRKRVQFLLPAIKRLSQKIDISKFELLILGTTEPIDPPDFNMKANYIWGELGAILHYH